MKNRKMSNVQNLKFFICAALCIVFGQSRSDFKTFSKYVVFGGGVGGLTRYLITKNDYLNARLLNTESKKNIASAGVGFVPVTIWGINRMVKSQSPAFDPLNGYAWAGNAAASTGNKSDFLSNFGGAVKDVLTKNIVKKAFVTVTILAAPTLGNFVQFRNGKLTDEGVRLKENKDSNYGKLMHKMSSFWLDESIGYVGNENVDVLLKRAVESNKELVAIPVLQGADVHIYAPVNINQLDDKKAPVVVDGALNANDIMLVEASNAVEQSNLDSLYKKYAYSGKDILIKVQPGDHEALKKRMQKSVKEQEYIKFKNDMLKTYPSEKNVDVDKKMQEIFSENFNSEIQKNKILTEIDDLSSKEQKTIFTVVQKKDPLESAKSNLDLLMQKKLDYEAEKKNNNENFENKKFVVYQINNDASLNEFKQKIINKDELIAAKDIENTIPDTQVVIENNIRVLGNMKKPGRVHKWLDTLNNIFAFAIGAKIEKGAHYISNNPEEAAKLLKNIIIKKNKEGQLENNLKNDEMRKNGVGSLVQNNTYKWTIGRCTKMFAAYTFACLGLGAYYKSK